MYLKGFQLLLLNIALGLGTFIQILDTSIANVAVPYIAGNLSVSADQGTWVITSFAVSNAIVLPLTGWLSDYFGRVRLFVWSVLLFALMSFLCGFSSSLAMLVTFRVLQGAVAGCLIPLSQSLIMEHNPPEKQGGAMGFWSSIVVVAPVAGPIMGGYLTDEYSWPWIFYINVPIGIFSAFMVRTLLKGRETKIVRNPIDWVGLGLLSLSVGALQVMLDKGKDLDWYESNFILILTIVAVIAFCYFCLWNSKQKYPIIDFSFFKDRNFAIGTLCITMGYLFFFGSTVTVPLWLQTQQSYNAFWAGVAVAPIGIIPVLLSVRVGRNLKNFDLRVVVATSFLFFGLGFMYQSNFTTEISIVSVMLARFFQGFGLLIFFLPLLQLSLGNISKEKYASAAGLFNFIRILVGSGFGTSLAIYLWSRLAIFHHARLSESVTIYRSVTTQFYEYMSNANAHFVTPVVDRVLDQLVTQQAYMLSTNDLSWMSAWIYILLIPLPLLCKRVVVKTDVQPVAAH